MTSGAWLSEKECCSSFGEQHIGRVEVKHAEKLSRADWCRSISDSWRSTLAVAIETAKIALAPSLPLLSVPSSSNIFWSTSFWLTGFNPCDYEIEALQLHVKPHAACVLLQQGLTTTAGAITLLMFSTALETPLPM